MLTHFFTKEKLEDSFEIISRQEQVESSLNLDPIWYPVFDSIQKNREYYFEELYRAIITEKYSFDKAEFFNATKDSFGLRPIAMLTLSDRIVYQCLFHKDNLGNLLDDQFLDVNFGNRLDTDGESYLLPYKKPFSKYLDLQIVAYKKGYMYYAHLDIKAFYDSILLSKLGVILENEFNVDAQVVIFLKRMLSSWIKHEDLPQGIPQGPYASHVLANAYFHPIDKFILNEINKKNVEYFRYVDDIVLMSQTKSDIQHLLSSLPHKLLDYKLEINEKTRLAKLPNADIILERKISTDYSPNTYVPSRVKVDKIIASLKTIFKKVQNESSTKKDRSSLRYFLKAVSYEQKYLEDVIGLLERLPSLAFLIARFLEQGIQDKNCYEAIKRATINLYDPWTVFWLFKLLVTSKHFENSVYEKIKVKSWIMDIIFLWYCRMNNIEISTTMDTIVSKIEKLPHTLQRTNYLYLCPLGDKKIRGLLHKKKNVFSLDEKILFCSLLGREALDKLTQNDLSDHAEKNKNVQEYRQEQIVRLAEDQLSEIMSVIKPKYPIKKKTENTNLPKCPFTIPAGTDWNQISIVFSDKENVAIHFNKKQHSTNYVDMGFKNHKSGKPNLQWTFLYSLAKLQGEITKKDTEAKDSFPKAKENLSKTLKSYFSIDYDPFYPYKNEIADKGKQRNSYMIKMTVFIKEQLKVKETEVDDITSPYDDFSSFYNEETRMN